MEEEQKEQVNNRPWLFKKGTSGNPLGRPPGRSLKDRAKAYLSGLTDEEAVEFFEGMDKKTVWEMAEGRAKQDMELSGKLSISNVLDQLENGRSTTSGQILENPALVQDTQQESRIDTVQAEQGAGALQPAQMVQKSDS